MSAAELPAAVTALPVLPPRPWQWWVSFDGETYHDHFDSMEPAIKYATDCGYPIVAEALQGDYHLEVTGDEILELLYGQNEDMVGEGEFLEPTAEQIKALGDAVSEAIELWARKYNIDTTAWAFEGVRNRMKVCKDAAPSPV